MTYGAAPVVQEPDDGLTPLVDAAQRLVAAVNRVVLGHDREVRLAVAALLAREHLLVEDAPGTGKTLLARTLAAVIGGHHRRVQATPDLLPADVTGTSVYQPATGGWEFRPGPVFTNVLLVDEINRAAPRTQSALLEPMEEAQVTVDGQTRRLPDPFLLIATQNPLGDAGTHPLPASQLDRFGVVLSLGRPDRAAQRQVLDGSGGFPALDATLPALDPAASSALAEAVRSLHVAGSVTEFLLDLSDALWGAPGTVSGPSARANLSLLRLARAWALLDGRPFVTPTDIRDVIAPVLAHRVVIEGVLDVGAARDRVAEIVAAVPTPRPG